MTYAEQASLATEQGFRLRVKVALLHAALDVLGETQGGVSAVVWGKRQAFAAQVIVEPDRYLDRVAWAVVTDTSMGQGTSDTDLQNRVNGLWNDQAGVLGGE